MKPFALWLGGTIALLGLSSCYSAADHSQLDDLSSQLTTVSFNLHPEGLDLDMLSRANGTLGVPQEVIVFDCYQGTNTYQVFDDISNVNLPLHDGTHDLYFVASVLPSTARSSGSLIVKWANDGTMKAVWAKHYQLTVTEGTSFEDILLPLVVSAARFETYDCMSTDVKAWRIEAPDASTMLDLKTMQAYAGSNAEGYSQTQTVSLANPSRAAFNVYTFVPASGSIGDITFSFYSDAEATQELSSRVVSDVQVRAGYRSNYKGWLFSSGYNVPLTYETDWLGTDEYEF